MEINTEFVSGDKNKWKEIKEIYFEAFPKAERKPFVVIKNSVQKGKARMFLAVKDKVLQGFAIVIPYHDMVMVDYLAVSGKIRSRGTGSRIMQEVCRQFPDKRIVLLIEKPDAAAPNKEQRISRRKFYIKNVFCTSGIFISGVSGEMEILSRGGKVSLEEYMGLQQYALGKLLFQLSKIKVV